MEPGKRRRLIADFRLAGSAAYWKIVPRRGAPDLYHGRDFPSQADAEALLAAMRKRIRYKVVGFNAAGKRVPR